VVVRCASSWHAAAECRGLVWAGVVWCGCVQAMQREAPAATMARGSVSVCRSKNRSAVGWRHCGVNRAVVPGGVGGGGGAGRRMAGQASAACLRLRGRCEHRTSAHLQHACLQPGLLIQQAAIQRPAGGGRGAGVGRWAWPGAGGGARPGGGSAIIPLPTHCAAAAEGCHCCRFPGYHATSTPCSVTAGQVGLAG